VTLEESIGCGGGVSRFEDNPEGCGFIDEPILGPLIFPI